MVDENIDIGNETAFASAVYSGWQSGSMDEVQASSLTYKTHKIEGAGRKSSATGRTLLGRFAISRGVQHDKLNAYIAGDSGFGPNDDTALVEIAGKLLQSYASVSVNEADLFQRMATDLYHYGNPPADSPAEAPTVVATPKLEFGVGATKVVAPTVPSLPTVPATPVAVEAPVATATPANDKLIFNSFGEFTAWVESMTPAQLEAMKKTLDAQVHAFFYTNERSTGGVARFGGWNGAGSATEWLDANQLKTQAGWDEAIQNASFHIVADVLEIRPKRKVGSKSRSWFWQLLDTSDARTNGTRIYLCELLAGVLVNQSGRTHYNARMAVHVSDAFRNEMVSALALKTSVRDSAVVGGTAKSWNWPYEAGGFQPRSATQVDSITADTFSLSNL